MAILGNFLALYVDGNRIALATSNDFGMKRAMIDITEKESGGFKEVMPGLKEASGNLEGIITGSIVNLLQFPESFDHPIWSKNGDAEVNGTRINNPYGQLLAQTLTWGTGDQISQTIEDSLVSIGDFVCFAIDVKGTGTIKIEVGEYGTSILTNSITLTADWVRHYVVYELAAATNVYVAVNKLTGSTVSIANPQLEKAEIPTSYKGAKETFNDLVTIEKNRALINIMHTSYISGDQSYVYDGYITDLQIKASANDKVTFSCNFQGTGNQTINNI